MPVTCACPADCIGTRHVCSNVPLFQGILLADALHTSFRQRSIACGQRYLAALLRHAGDHEVEKVENSRFGTRYIIDGIIHAPDGRSPVVRSVWFTETGERIPRFVTAYPLPRRAE